MATFRRGVRSNLPILYMPWPHVVVSATVRVCEQVALSCRKEATRLSIVSFNIPTAQFFLLLVTAASDLLVHKILLNSILLSPIVSGSVRPKPPGQTPPRS